MKNDINIKKEKQFKEALYWGGAFFWAGLVFGADLVGLLPRVGNLDTWSWIFLGVGLYGLVGSLFFLLSPNWSNPTPWDFIWSGFWFLVGLSGFILFDIIWAVGLILLGLLILAVGFARQSDSDLYITNRNNAGQ